MQQEQASRPDLWRPAPQPPACPGRSCGCFRHLGSWPKGFAQHHLTQRPLDKKDFPAAASASSQVLWNFLYTTFSGWRSSLVCAGLGARTWPGRGAGGRDARSGRPPNPSPAPRHRPSGYPSHEWTRQLARMLVGFVTWGVCVCLRAPAPPPACAPRALPPGWRPPCARRFQRFLPRGESLSRLSLRTASSSAPRVARKNGLVQLDWEEAAREFAPLSEKRPPASLQNSREA